MANREDELSFQVITGRGEAQKISDVLRFNFRSSAYEPAIMHTYDGMFSLVRLILRENGDLTGGVCKIFLTNYPNLFRPETKVFFMVSQNAKACLSIYNIKGERIKTLFEGTVSRGIQEVVWSGTDNFGKKVSPGIYLYQLKVGDKAVANKKCILLK